jgi:hypothetical protein
VNAPETSGSPTTSLDQPRPGRPAANAASMAVLGLEVLGSFLMWAPIPVAWIWVAARIVDSTGSVALGGGAALLGLAATTMLMITLLARIDRVWISLRRQAGRDQDQGALSQVVVVSVTLVIVAFMIWSISNRAVIIPFMPNK